MSICRARLRNTSNALMLRMSGKQIRLQVPPKLFGVDSWWSGSEIKTVGLATENARVPKVLRRTSGTNSWWHLADCRRLMSLTEYTHSSLTGGIFRNPGHLGKGVM